jgi:dipeptidyl aminopeptidase/acylaminoacyl peptidase
MKVRESWDGDAARGLLDTLLAVRQVTHLSLSPEGQRLAYALVEADREADVNVSTVRTCSLEAPQDGPVFVGGGPQWSPRGDHVAWIAPALDGLRQVSIMDVGSGSARALGAALRSPTSLSWSTEGASLAFCAVGGEVPPVGAPRVVDNVCFRREGVGFLEEQELQLYLGDLESGAVRQVTRGPGESFAPCWSPDDRKVAFVRERDQDGPRRRDLFVLELSDGRERQLTGHLANVAAPAWSPNGRWIAFYGSEDTSGGEDHEWGLFLLDPKSGVCKQLGVPDEAIVLAKDARGCPPPIWEDDSHLLARVARRGYIELGRFDLQGGYHPIVEGPRQVLGYDARGGHLAFVTNEALDPAVLSWRRPAAEAAVVKRFNSGLSDQLAGLEISPREFRMKSGAIGGWFIRRRGGQRPAPLAISLHGGPHAYSSGAFSIAHSYRYILAALGWCVLLLNHSGSASYGRRFASAIHRRWGEIDRDEVLGSAAMLVESGDASPESWAVIGYYYGGFLAGHLLAHTERFKAGVIGAPIANVESFAGTSDIGPWFIAREGGEDSWKEFGRAAVESPTAKADLVKAPTLLLHGEADLRCPIGQSEELFAALKAAGRAPIRFVRYPGADHGFPSSGKPSHRADYHRRIVEWLCPHLPSEA